MASASPAFFQLLKTTGFLARTRIAPIALAAVLPFVASHLVVMQARHIGMPERLVLDLLHGFIVLAYLTAAVRIAQSRAAGPSRFGFAQFGFAQFGFAWPRRIVWPRLGTLLRMAGIVVLIGLPLALLAHPLVQMLEAVQADTGITFPVTMLPEFVMTTLVGLVLAAGTGKMLTTQKPQDPP